MSRLGAVLIIGAITGVTAACTGYGSGPDVAGYTQTGVIIRYDPGDVTDAEVAREAQSQCDSYDGQAVLRGRADYVREAKYQTFDCVLPGTLVTEPAAVAAEHPVIPPEPLPTEPVLPAAPVAVPVEPIAPPMVESASPEAR